MNHALPLLLLLLLSGLSGCTQPGPGFTPECIEDVCIVSPDDPDAAYMRETYGLHWIARSDPGEMALNIGGNLVAWQSTTHNSQAYGYNINTGDLIPVAVDPQYHHTRVRMANEIVVYKKGPETGALESGWPYMETWNANTGNHRRLDTGMQGTPLPWDINEDWVLFSNRGSPDDSEVGTWALNLHDDRLIKVYTPIPYNLSRDGYLETLFNQALSGNKVYYTVFRTNNEDSFNSTIHEFDLETETRRVVFFEEQVQVNKIDSSEWYLVMELSKTPHPNLNIVVLDLHSLETKIVSGDRPDVTFPSAGGKWVTFISSGADDGLYALHVPTMTEVAVVPNVEEIGGFRSDTDGRRVVAEVVARRSDNLQGGLFRDLFWFQLPEIPAESSD